LAPLVAHLIQHDVRIADTLAQLLDLNGFFEHQQAQLHLPLRVGGFGLLSPKFTQIAGYSTTSAPSRGRGGLPARSRPAHRGALPKLKKYKACNLPPPGQLKVRSGQGPVTPPPGQVTPPPPPLHPPLLQVTGSSPYLQATTSLLAPCWPPVE